MGKRAIFTAALLALALVVAQPVSNADAASVDLTITPTVQPTAVPVTAEITATVAGGSLTDVTMTDRAGNNIPGALRADGSSWVPASALRFNTGYTATITATDPTGAQKSVTTSFTTMAKPPTRPIAMSVNVSDNATYGVAMPIVVTFSTGIPTKNRAAIERRLFVQSDPVQRGVWSWQSATQVVYRPQTYWQPGTSITLNTQVAGLPDGSRLIGDDHSATFTIGKDLEYAADAKAHVLTITSDGQVIHKYPISMGKSSTPSWSGHFVIMDKLYYTVFNTIGIPGENYITPVHYAERLTLSGTYFHAAPWSVGQQGSTNVSHGCVNLAPYDAAWIYHNSQVGDPVSLSGTPIHAAQGNGWTMWDMSWADFVKGSAAGFAQYTPSAGAQPAI